MNSWRTSSRVAQSELEMKHRMEDALTDFCETGLKMQPSQIVDGCIVIVSFLFFLFFASSESEEGEPKRCLVMEAQ